MMEERKEEFIKEFSDGLKYKINRLNKIWDWMMYRKYEIVKATSKELMALKRDAGPMIVFHKTRKEAQNSHYNEGISDAIALIRQLERS